jgi:hypothetical protein
MTEREPSTSPEPETRPEPTRPNPGRTHTEGYPPDEFGEPIDLPILEGDQ